MSTMPMNEEERRRQIEEMKRQQPGLLSILAGLSGATTSRAIADSGPSIFGNVGNNMDNDDEDVRTVRRTFDEMLNRPVAQRETDPAGRPLGIITQQMDDDIRTFQKDNDLKVDGYLEPGGETVMAMAAQLQKKQEAAKPASPLPQKPAEEKPAQASIPAPPDYRKEVFKGSRRAEWEEFNATLEKREDLNPAQRQIMRDIFAAEGGRDSHPDSGAFAGILPSTLKNHIEQGKVPGIVTKHGNKVENTKLDSNDLVEIYKSHLNDTMSSAIKGHNDRNPHEKTDSIKLLGNLGSKLGGAVADTMFVNGNEGAKMVQNALNKHLPDGKKITVTPAIGSGSYQALIEISKDEKKTNSFIETLGIIRKTEEQTPDINRIYHHRLNR